MDTTQRNKAIVTRFVEHYQSGRDETVFDQSIHPYFVDRSRPPGVSEGPQGVREQFDAFHAAFDGFRAQVLRQVAEGDLVVTHKVFRGTHRGEIMGVAPTGRDVEIAVIDIVRLENGQIIEHWNLVDLYGLMAQIAEPTLVP